MVHIHDEVVPVWVVVNEAGSIDKELEDGLESAIDSLEVLRDSFDLDHFKCLLVDVLLAPLPLLVELEYSSLALLSRDIAFEALNLGAWKLELLLSLLLQVLDELVAIR